VIVRDESAAGPSREDAALMRRRLLNAGAPKWLVSSTPDIGLPALLRRTIPHLTLVPDVEEHDELAEVLHPVFGEVIDPHAIGAQYMRRAIRDLGLPMPDGAA
jgi:hypothetical protein